MIKKAGLLSAFIIINSCLFASVTSISVLPVGTNSQYLEATTTNVPVFHLTVTADALGGTLTGISLQNILNSYGYGNATEPLSIAANSVKMWYSPGDVSFNSANYVTFLAMTDSTHWGDSTFVQPINNGDGIWISIDIPLNPAFGTVQFQSNGLTFTASTVTSFNEPAQPPVLLLTSSIPMNNMQVSHISGNMQPLVSTGQQNIITTKLLFSNNSGSTSAAALINSIALSAVNYSGGATLDSSTIISDIKIADDNLGNVYGELSILPSSPVPMNIPVAISVPPNSTITADVIITIKNDPLAAGTHFYLSLPQFTDIACVDSYTNAFVSATAVNDSFPMTSSPATIQKNALQAGFSFDGSIIPPTVNKGQTNIPLASLVFNNPGDSETAYVQVYNLKFHLIDSYGNPVVPKDIFSKISLTDPTGTIIYGSKPASSLEPSGDLLSMTLLNPIPVQPGPANVTVEVSADISLSTTAQNFKIGIDSLSDIQARDANSFNPAVISPLSAPAPYYSGLTLLSSFFTVSHQKRMPSNIYSGQAGINAMTLNLTSPLPYGAGNILVRGVTLSARDENGSPVNMSDVVSKFGIFPEDASYGQTITAVPASPDLYLPFAQDVKLTTTAGEAVNFIFQLKNTASGSVQFQITGASAISAYQDTDPSRSIYISPAPGESFPMLSGIGYINGSASTTSFSTYPNPFRQGSSCRLAYYLAADSKVTIKIFDIMGNLVRSITENSAKPAGSHNEDTWDGKGDNGRFVIAGTYISRIEAKGPSGTKTFTVKTTFIK